MSLYRIIALGDSLTYGYPFGKPLSWVEKVSHELNCPILNQGINGDTIGHMLRRLTHDVLDLHPEFCIVLGGTNDVYQEIDFELMKANCIKLIERILENQSLPILGLPPPVKDRAYEKILAKFRNWLKRYARELSLKTIDFHAAFLDKRKHMLPAYLEDGVHPSAKGYEAMAQAAALVLKPLI